MRGRALAAPLGMLAAGGVGAWYVNAAGFPGGAGVVLIGLPVAAFLAARLSFRDVAEPGLWLAAVMVVSLVVAGIVISRAVPGHAALERRIEGLQALGQADTSPRRTGSTTCLPRCARVAATYRSASPPDVAVATAVSVLTQEGFEPDAAAPGGSAPVDVVALSRNARLLDGPVSITVRGEPHDGGSKVAVTIAGHR